MSVGGNICAVLVGSVGASGSGRGSAGGIVGDIVVVLVVVLVVAVLVVLRCIIGDVIIGSDGGMLPVVVVV